MLTLYGGSLQRALQAIYAEHKWSPYRFSKPHQVPKGKSSFSKNQYSLFQMVQKGSIEQLRYIADSGIYFPSAMLSSTAVLVC